MTVKECYERLGGDYEKAKARLMNDKFIDRFILMFPEDGSMELLRSSIASGNHDEAFRGVHTLKGVAANLSFTALQNAASALTEQLRDNQDPADPTLVKKVEESYNLVISVLASYAAEKA